MNIDIFCISDSDKHFSSAIDEYIKRLGKQCAIHHIKPIKHGTREQISEKETQLLVDKIQHKQFYDATIILLEKDGEQRTSEQFSKKVYPGSHCVFLIGGPYGLDVDVIRTYIHHIISFGKQTLPHGLAQLVLLEQVYRSTMIQKNKSYHY